MLNDRSLVKEHELKIRLNDYNNEKLNELLKRDGRTRTQIAHDIIEQYLKDMQTVSEQKQA